MPRPIKLDKKQPITIKLPPYLVDWMDRQNEKRPELIETALLSYYQIPSHLEPDFLNSLKNADIDNPSNS